ncbi:hypothetical protein TNCV_4068351 [Trichonephila clavipes]|nr:hypothetical protein TNCV_4068351 [Trichonephila clavipes]
MVAFAVIRWRHEYCGSLCMARVTNVEKLELPTFETEYEYLSHQAKTIVIAWRVLLVYIDITATYSTFQEAVRAAGLSKTYDFMNEVLDEAASVMN